MLSIKGCELTLTLDCMDNAIDHLNLDSILEWSASNQLDSLFHSESKTAFSYLMKTLYLNDRGDLDSILEFYLCM